MPIIDDTSFDYTKIGQGTYNPNNYTSDANNPGGGFDWRTVGAPTGSGGSAVSLLDPKNARMAISGMPAGGFFGQGKTTPTISISGAADKAAATGDNDWRVRVSLAPNCKMFYQDPLMSVDAILSPLVQTNGVIWPYTPSISVTHNAHYTTAQLTHSNYPAHFYNNSEVADIQISGDFTVQGAADGQYLMAVIYFFRTVTKMFFGQGANVGNPPPLVFLDGYGSHYFPHIPCVVTSFSHNLPNDVDYLPVPVTSQTQTSFTSGNPGQTTSFSRTQTNVNGSIQTAETGKTTFFGGPTQDTITKTIQQITRLPALSTVSITLRPMYSRRNIHERFNLNDFAEGALLADPDKGLGGFI